MIQISFLLCGCTGWADPEKRQVAVNIAITAGFFQCAIKAFEQGMLDFDFAAAGPADQVMVVIPRNLIGEMSVAAMRGPHETVFCEKFEGAVDGRLCDTGKFLNSS